MHLVVRTSALKTRSRASVRCLGVVLTISSAACASVDHPLDLDGGEADAACGDLDAATCGTFDPRGTDVPLYGDWDVNGKAPSNEACLRAGLDHVELVLIEPSTNREFTSDAFRFPCALPFFETAPVRVLAAGEYEYQWRAYDDDELVLRSRRYPMTAERDVEFELQRVDFQRRAPVSIEFALSWQSSTEDDSCAGAMVSAGYSYSLFRGASPGSGTPLASFGSGATVACADTLVLHEDAARSLVAGTYSLDVRGLSAGGASWRGTCVVEVPDGGPVRTECSIPRAP